MTEPTYAQVDDFQKAAARIAVLANSGLKDAQDRLSREGFFKRAKLARTFEPSMNLLRELLAPVNAAGMSMIRDPEAARLYCEGMADMTAPHMRKALDAEPGVRRLVMGNVALMMEKTTDVLTKSSHGRCWMGSEQLADEMRKVFPD